MTRISVLVLLSFLRHFSWISLATLESTAEIGSSRIKMSESAYKALARASLAFCPPDKVIPFSPTIVSSPC